METTSNTGHGGCVLHGHPAHFPPVRRHNQRILVLVTVCIRERRALLAQEEMHRVLASAWRQADRWHVGEYLLMPDHVHLFCTPGTLEGYPLQRWVGYWKRQAGNLAPALKGQFQEDCWDTQMRSREHYEEKLSYVRNNPVRGQHVTRWEEWPHRGRMNDIGWY